MLSSWKYIALLHCGLCLSLLVSCNMGASSSDSKKGPGTDSAKAAVSVISLNPDVKVLTKDFRSFWEYWYDSVDLTRDFTPVDPDNHPITKFAFLRELNTGKYMPVITEIAYTATSGGPDQGVYTYKLVPLSSKVASGIPSTIKQMTTKAITEFKKEGSELPSFNLTTIEGKSYTNQNCKGKLLVIDTWFVKCGACVQEMPVLNRWVYQYKNDPDILFLSLCLDDKTTIEKFLTRQGFAFQIVPDATNYIEHSLGITEFPTKILVNKEGKIVKTGNFLAIKRELTRLAGH